MSVIGPRPALWNQDEVIDLQYIIKLLSKIRFKILKEDTYDVNLFDNFVSGLYRGYSYHND